ncbi:MAG: peptidylprolyl isomerase [Verrucomicrobiota bacterium JB023]|nr:peptidylprolyl isomerase [Verrucomicrobiota bacterium JB023]
MMLRVNGELLDPNLVEATFERLKEDASRRTGSSTGETDDALYQAAEDEVIDTILIASEAERQVQELDEERIREGLAALEEEYRRQGAPEDFIASRRDELRQEVVAGLRMAALIDAKVGTIDEASEEDLQGYYETHREDYRSVPEARCYRLMKLIDSAADPAVLLQEMIDLRERLLGGEDFLTVAGAEAGASTGEVDLGWIALDRPSNPFEAVLSSLRLNEISPVLSYEMAFHLVMVIDRRGGDLPPLSELREELAERWQTEKKRDAVKAFAATLRQNARIERVDFSAD